MHVQPDIYARTRDLYKSMKWIWELQHSLTVGTLNMNETILA